MAEGTGDGFGYGQGNPNDAADPFNLTSFMIRQLLLGIVTAKVVKVTAVHPGEGTPAAPGTVDVQPLVKQVDGNNTVTSHGVVYGLPWVRLQGGKHGFITDPVVGDVGVVIAMDRDSSGVKEGGWKEGPPGSLRSHDLADGVYIGGAFGLAPESYVQINDDGIKIADKNQNIITTTADGVTLTDKTGNVVGMNAQGVTITPKTGLPVTVNGNFVLNGNLQISGNIEAVDGSPYAGDLKTTGNVIAGFGGGDQVGLQTHTHQYDRPTGTSSPAQTIQPTAGT